MQKGGKKKTAWMQHVTKTMEQMPNVALKDVLKAASPQDPPQDPPQDASPCAPPPPPPPLSNTLGSPRPHFLQ